MSTLFWKIFLTFWVALLLFSAATVITAGYFLEQKRQAQEDVSPRALLRSLVRDAQSVARREGPGGLREWLRALDRREAIPFLLLDSQGEDLLGRSVPEHLGERIRGSRFGEFGHPRMPHRLAFPRVQLADGQGYWLVPDYHGVTLGRVLARPRLIALPIILAALISGTVCFSLTRYLTRPIKQLHQATEEYARGNLSHRVAPRMGRRNDELADLARAFDRMAEHLAGLIQTHKRLLRDVSHELRSPLARIQVALELARKRSEGRAEKELARIEQAAERLNDLIGQLLSLARLESQQQPTQTENVDMAELVAGIAEDIGFEAQNRPCKIVLARLEKLIVSGDPMLLHMAVENVVRNAVRYTEAGGAVELSLEHDARRPGCVRLSVRDHGPGVSPALLPHLFEPFVRADDARSRNTGGYGLGLAIADRVVRLHGGTISADNATGGGLRVELRLPLLPTT